MEPDLFQTVRARRKPVPLWIPIIGIGCLVAALIFGIANVNRPQTVVVTATPAAVFTATENAVVAAEAATPTIVQVVVPPSTPTPEAAGQPAPTATLPSQNTAVVVQPTPTQAAQPVAPTAAPPAPTATPRPAPTVPPVVAVPTTQPAPPAQPQPTPTQAPAPTATKVPAPPTTAPAAPATATPSQPAATPTQVPLNSQGLGLFRTEWEKWHGQGVQKDNGVYYENEKYLVVFYEDRIVRLERMYGVSPVTIDAARTESKNFLPEDAKLVQTYVGPDGVPVDLYSSEVLKTYFASVNDPDFWKGGQPGNFIVQYRKSDQPNLYSAIVITLGNNPQKNP